MRDDRAEFSSHALWCGAGVSIVHRMHDHRLHPRLPDPRRSGRAGARAGGSSTTCSAATASMRCWCRRRWRRPTSPASCATRSARATSAASGSRSRTRRRWSALLDECDRAGRIAGAVNAARRLPDGRIEGALFDGVGFVKALDHFGIAARGRSALVVGVGGGGVAVAAALAERGVKRLDLFDPMPRPRRRGGATAARGVRHRRARAQRRRPGGLRPRGQLHRRSACKPDDPLPFDAARLHAGAAVVDIMMKNQPTALLRACQARGIDGAARLRDAGAAGARVPVASSDSTPSRAPCSADAGELRALIEAA